MHLKELDPVVVSMGPHHPSMHGVLRLVVTSEGENVADSEIILGYLHRGMEKIAENRAILQYLPYVTRWDYLATTFAEAVTVNAPEKLANIQIPGRASYIRVIMLELSRIASHLLRLGPFLADIGAQTPFFYIFRASFNNPRAIDKDLINAQQARRALDYLVGFTLSPILWRKLPGCKSAGRVAEWLKATDCKSVEGFLRRFESCLSHPNRFEKDLRFHG